MSYNAERTKIINIQFAKILGVNHYSQALRLLDKIIIIELARLLNKDTCTCGEKVTIENFTLGHIKPWRRCWSRSGDADLFWDIDNIYLQHGECNITDNTKSNSFKFIDAPSKHEGLDGIKDQSLVNQANFDRDLLGMDFGKANHQLYRNLIFNWCCEANLNKCAKCLPQYNLIEDIDEFSIEHLRPWLDGKDNEEKKRLFFSWSNIGFSHERCNCSSSRLGTGESGLNGVSPYLNKRTSYQGWRARIDINGKTVTLKHSKDPIECAENYDMAILKYHKGKGLLNYPDKIQEYNKKIMDGWHEQPRCKISGCAGKHLGLGYCRKHHYEFCGGKEKRRARTLAAKG